MRRVWFLLLALVMTLALVGLGCGEDESSSSDDDDNNNNDDTNDDTTDDDDDNNDDENNDDDDTIEDECHPGDLSCTGNALQLLECREGRWVVAEECLRDYGKLCETDTCVDPWRYGSPTFDDCAGDPHGTTMSLAEKAAKFDELAARLHIHPEHKRINNATVVAPYTEDDATWQEVTNWHTGENDGLWTGLYIASQAFRYASTGSQDALDVLRVMVDGLRIGMEITGIPGIFTREYITPGVAGMSCPSDPSSYIPDEEKDDNRWVKVDTDGTILVYDPDAAAFVRTTHQVSDEFAGYCWLDNVSQDEYAGHMLALGAIYKLVDDADLRDAAGSLMEQISEHLMENDMALVDWDDRLTEHGRFWPLAITDFPGFNAIMGMNMVLQGAVASGREDLRDFYDNCLLQKAGPNDCLDRYLTPPQPFTDWLWLTGLYVGRGGCQSNWNNMAMAFCQMFPLIWYEHDPATRHKLQRTFENMMFYFRENERMMANQHNAAWAIMYAAMKQVGPDSTGHDTEAIEDAICALRQFPESQTQPTLHIGEDEYPTDFTCESRFEGEYLTFDPVPVYERCPRTFTWWSNPYGHQNCDADPQYIRQPAGYLLPYWMARYFGYVGAVD
ncbi:MAG: hypothetical protein P9L99_02500 [Candidatus Lernaella stagnicola]|nr:hypothetical protein [Candidatus Lernaella stagnicola]